jgi:lipopolysaccharide assembly outer membrane protein LptD (OstA)
MLFSGAMLPAMETVKLSSLFDPGIQLPDRKSRELQHARADSWRLNGRTLFVSGNVFIPYGNMLIHADSAMIDLESRDIEAKGNISFAAVTRKTITVTVDELEQLMNLPNYVVDIIGSEINVQRRHRYGCNNNGKKDTEKNNYFFHN